MQDMRVEKNKKRKTIFGVELVINVPNLLSIMRIFLVPVFAVLYIKGKESNLLTNLSYIVLFISGLTDLFDGMIARKLNQITEFGKILDPIADKLTQVVVVICLATRIPEMLPLLIICVVKEVCQGIGGLLLIYRGSEIDGAKWFGKVSTFVFYGVMILFLVFKDMDYYIRIVLIGIVAGLMLFSFIRYMVMFFNIKRDMPKKSNYKDKLEDLDNNQKLLS